MRDISGAERDAADGGDQEAGERAVERQPEIDPKFAADPSA